MTDFIKKTNWIDNNVKGVLKKSYDFWQFTCDSVLKAQNIQRQ